jgi:hypothetical protein
MPLTKAQMLAANALYLEADLDHSPWPGTTPIVNAVLASHIPMVVIPHYIWTYSGYADLAPALESEGIQIWWHLLPGMMNITDDRAWLTQRKDELIEYGATAVFLDGGGEYGGIRGGTPAWNYDYFYEYRQVGHMIVGDEGMVGGSCWMTDPLGLGETAPGSSPFGLDVVGYWEMHERDTLLGKAWNSIVNNRTLKTLYNNANLRYEAGWIGPYEPHSGSWEVPVFPGHIRMLWLLTYRNNMPLTYISGANRFISDAVEIGKAESLVQYLRSQNS